MRPRILVVTVCWSPIKWPRGPVSRILCPGAAGAVVISLVLPLPEGSCGLPGDAVGRRYRARRMSPYLALLQVGFASTRCHHRAWCALTAPFHPCPSPIETGDVGGLLSVALSVASRRLGVTQHLARGSPDFPPRWDRGDHLALLATPIIPRPQVGAALAGHRPCGSRTAARCEHVGVPQAFRPSPRPPSWPGRG